jgi:hypothetical protein
MFGDTYATPTPLTLSASVDAPQNALRLAVDELIDAGVTDPCGTSDLPEAHAFPVSLEDHLAKLTA